MEYQGRGRSEGSWGWEGVVRVGEKTSKVEEGGKERKRRRGVREEYEVLYMDFLI